MSKHKEQAALLLQKAMQDITVVLKLQGDKDIAPETLGFHAQQAAEKSLKALLAGHRISFPYTHRISELFDLLKDHGLPIPIELEEVRFLTPFAVEYRYAIPEEDSVEFFDVHTTLAALVKLHSWAEAILNAAVCFVRQFNDPKPISSVCWP